MTVILVSIDWKSDDSLKKGIDLCSEVSKILRCDAPLGDLDFISSVYFCMQIAWVTSLSQYSFIALFPK